MTPEVLSDELWEALSDFSKCQLAARAVYEDGGDESEIVRAVEKPWNYREEIANYLKKEGAVN